MADNVSRSFKARRRVHLSVCCCVAAVTTSRGLATTSFRGAVFPARVVRPPPGRHFRGPSRWNAPGLRTVATLASCAPFRRAPQACHQGGAGEEARLTSTRRAQPEDSELTPGDSPATGDAGRVIGACLALFLLVGAVCAGSSAWDGIYFYASRSTSSSSISGGQVAMEGSDSMLTNIPRRYLAPGDQGEVKPPEMPDKPALFEISLDFDLSRLLDPLLDSELFDKLLDSKLLDGFFHP
ncbi:unnamed protein product [Polarella glacialis]|uniref:Uncharacterized protein n=1 Tax=Polarella glacialis TaxID=89957 RepID=A0A813LML1_POLGL|nr:unnamed protein product [Polarella glacialis]CAE8637321.1 unnamed protein product [Polarella glacialis]CAE8736176.1 unnamed protein product [Polarella glacialis]